MPERNTVLRSMHDLGLAAWFGGSLMGAVGLNVAAKGYSDSWRDNARIARTSSPRYQTCLACASRPCTPTTQLPPTSPP
ncbi:hypothetical protein [Streptomyces virginiae]|uniref:hypothetical protein n=1 Tax=Streptomyces virginiae TaxID=1961 RepID=UPI002255D7D5|nr:hypothetical protein [Streptomyces virginiae]MCX4721910.1 hypothetical protein [Streptomyces virginiae]MCX5276828.1 hypothetical protein [Streptomyces virginiae]